MKRVYMIRVQGKRRKKNNKKKRERKGTALHLENVAVGSIAKLDGLVVVVKVKVIRQRNAALLEDGKVLLNGSHNLDVGHREVTHVGGTNSDLFAVAGFQTDDVLIHSLYLWSMGVKGVRSEGRGRGAGWGKTRRITK